MEYFLPYLLAEHTNLHHDEDLYALPEDKVKNIPTVCGSLREAMESLDRDRSFLKQGGVFSDDQIDAFIALKFEEIYNLGCKFPQILMQ